MRYTTFGRCTGLRVSDIALGTGNFGTSWGGGADRAEAGLIFDRFAQVGGNFIDTADMYQSGEAETLLGEFLGKDRDEFVIATKYGYGAAATGSVLATGNGRKNMMRSVEGSLKRLKTDHIDILWAHAPDGLTPIEEIAKSFEDLISSGKVCYAGLSNFPAWRVVRAVDQAHWHGWSGVSAIQVAYSLVERTAERELLPMAETLGLGVGLWSPLGGGLLTGKYRHSKEGRLSDWNRVIQREDNAHKTAVMDAVIAAATELQLKPVEVALAWIRQQASAATTALIPIIGPRTVAQLDQYLTSLATILPDEIMTRLDDVSAISFGVPHESNAAQLTALSGGVDLQADGRGRVV